MLQLYATDKEIYDLIMASSRRLSTNALVELLQDRRIFVGVNERSRLADILATLPHDFHDVAGLVQKGEISRRSERTTAIQIPGHLSLADLRDALKSYGEDVGTLEAVHTQTATAHRLRVHIEYDEIEYSRTSLIQKQRRSSDFDFHIDQDRVTVRFPAGERAREIVNRITDQLSSTKKETFTPEEISVAHLTTASKRSDFFLKLMHGVAGFDFATVTDVRVGRFSEHIEHQDDEDATTAIGGRPDELISFIQSVTMRGENLVVTPEFQRLMEGGFFITALTWDADRRSEPRDLMRFDVSFEDGVAGTGLRYALRYKTRRSSGVLTTTFQPVPDIDRPRLFSAIESAARNVLAAMKTRPSAKPSAEAQYNEPADEVHP